MYLKIIHNRIILLTDYMGITQDYQKKLISFRCEIICLFLFLYVLKTG